MARYFAIVTRRKGKGLKGKESPTCVSVIDGRKKPKTHALKHRQDDSDFCWFGIPTAFVPPDQGYPIVFWDKETTTPGPLPANLYEWQEYGSIDAVPEGTPEWMRLVVKRNDIRVLVGVPSEFLKLEQGDAVLMQYGGGEDAYAQSVRRSAEHAGATVYRTPSLSREFKRDVLQISDGEGQFGDEGEGESASASTAASKRESAFLACELQKFLMGAQAAIPIYEMLDAEELVEKIQFALNEYTEAQVARIRRGNYLSALAQREMCTATEYRLIEDEFEAKKAADVIHQDFVVREKQWLKDLESLCRKHPLHDALYKEAALSRGIGPVILGGIIAMTGGNIRRYDLPPTPERLVKIAEAQRLRDECIAQACGSQTLNERVTAYAALDMDCKLYWEGAGVEMRVFAINSATAERVPLCVAQRIAYMQRFLEKHDPDDANIPVLKDALRHARRLSRLRSRKRQIIARLESNAGLKCLGMEVPAHLRWSRTLKFVRRYWKTCYYVMDQVQRGTNELYRKVMEDQLARLTALYPEDGEMVEYPTKSGKSKRRKIHHFPHLKRMARRKAMIMMMRRIFRKMVDTLLPEVNAPYKPVAADAEKAA